MAVTLPSDLVLDVIRNADPSRRNAAAAKLQAIGDTRANPAAFAGMLEGLEPVQDSSGIAASPSRSNPVPEAFKGFEHMVLRNLFEAMMPGEESGAFGAGPAAGVWRSMAADQFAATHAESGGLGIAASLAEGDNGRSPVLEGQWPYFSVGRIESFAG